MTALYFTRYYIYIYIYIYYVCVYIYIIYNRYTVYPPYVYPDLHRTSVERRPEVGIGRWVPVKLHGPNFSGLSYYVCVYVYNVHIYIYIYIIMYIYIYIYIIIHIYIYTYDYNIYIYIHVYLVGG